VKQATADYTDAWLGEHGTVKRCTEHEVFVKSVIVF
jgi:hypothetical protein